MLVHIGQVCLGTGTAAGEVDKSPPNPVLSLLPQFPLSFPVLPSHKHTHTLGVEALKINTLHQSPYRPTII